jgi:RHS repeat-associated protein
MIPVAPSCKLYGVVRFIPFRLWVVFLCVICAATPRLNSQIIDEPVAVPVKFSGYNPGYRGGGGVTLTLNGLVSSRSNPGHSPTLTTSLEVGKSYGVVLTRTGVISTASATFKAPAGYYFLINGVRDNKFSSSSTTARTLRLIPVDAPPAATPGAASSLASGRMRWSVSLGSLPNGNSAGTLDLVGGAISDWTDFYRPAALEFESDSPVDVTVHRATPSGGLNAIRQVAAPQVFVDVVILTATSYEIRVYHPTQATGSTYPKPLTGLPFLVYRLEQDGSPTKLRITKTSRNPSSATDTTAPVARVDYTTLERSGTYPTFTWTLIDWTQDGHPPLTREVRQWSGNTSGGHDELITQLDEDDEVVSVVDRVHTGHPWGHTPTQMIVGEVSDSPVTANTEYYTNSSHIGSYGMPRQNTSTGGAWSIMEYQAATETDKAGVVSRTFAPYLNTPATPPLIPDLNQGVVMSYAYENDAFGMPTRVTSVETKINGVLVSKSTSTYGSASANGQQLVHRTTKDQINQAGEFIQTDMSYYREDTYDEFFRGQIRMSAPSIGAKQSYIRQRGNLNTGTYAFSVQSSGKATRIGVVSGSSLSSQDAIYLTTHAGYDLADLYILPNKSTLEWTLRDAYARVVRTESHIWDGTTWQLVGWTNFEYNLNSQLVSSLSHNGDIYEAGYSGEFKTWERSATGKYVSYAYDVHGRLVATTDQGYGTQPDLVSTVEYDGAHRAIRETISSPATTETLVTERTYDLAGRVRTESRPGHGSIIYSYDPTARRSTVTAPDLTYVTTEAYIDGQAYSQTGTGTVPAYTTYGVESDGRRWTRTDVLTPTSPRWQKGWVDWLNRPIRAERPGFSGQGDFVEENLYDPTTGQLVRVNRTGTAPTLYAYDTLGARTHSALDVNQNGVIDLAGPDRVSGSDSWLAFEEGAWWAAERSFGYISAGSAAETTLGSSRRRLNGFTGTLRGESRATDVEGNIATSFTYVDRAIRTVSSEQFAPGVANPATSVAVNGQAVTSTAPDGLVSTPGYDALRRPVSAVDPRTGTYTTTYYPGTTLVHTQIDARNVTVATYTYDVLGRRIAVTDTDGKTSRVSFHPFGGVSRQWGDTAIPVSYGYDDYGQRVTQSTYRAGTAWNSATWPEATTGNADTTTWTYDEATGLLKKKTDATDRYVEYAYNVRGQPTHRYWARTVDGTPGGARVTATYTYDPVTADPVATSYNDGTPGTSLTYDRSGRPLTRTDAAGTRAYAYDPTQPWRFAGETLPAYFGGRVLTPQRNETTTATAGAWGPHTRGTVKGSQIGYALGSTADPMRDLRVLYHTANTGRLAGLEAYGPGGGHGGTGAFHYTYTANSRLVAGLHAPEAGQSATGYSLNRAYESHRDLLTSIETAWGSTAQVRYEYAYDNRARRTRAVQGGDAFEADYGDPVRTDYAYDDRGQLTAADAYLGADPQDTSRPLPGRRHAYSYDTMGNRTTSSHHSPDSTKTAGYRTNALNQYTDRDNKGVPYRGVARADAPVAVDGQLAARQERYFWDDVNFAADPAGRLFPLAAALAGAGTGGKDAVQLAYRFAFWPGATEQFDYDADGNLTEDATWTYKYDAENRLVQMERKGWTALPGAPPRQRLVFSYDYQGRRIGKTVYNLGTGTSDVQLQQDLRFIYDGWNLIAEIDATQPGLPLLRSYAWGLDLVGSLSASGGVGALVQIWDHVNDKRYVPAYDGNGNLAALFDAQAATMAAAYEYSPYGEAIRTSGTAAIAQDNPFRFSTKYTDAETGLIYYGMRYYDAKNGRFINRDPIEERGGLNLYGFCGNDGINHHDILGMLSLRGYPKTL